MGVQYTNECFKIQQILNFSDENDRQSFGLYAVKEVMKGDFNRSDFGLNTNTTFLNKNMNMSNMSNMDNTVKNERYSNNFNTTGNQINQS